VGHWRPLSTRWGLASPRTLLSSRNLRPPERRAHLNPRPLLETRGSLPRPPALPSRRPLSPAPPALAMSRAAGSRCAARAPCSSRPGPGRRGASGPERTPRAAPRAPAPLAAAAATAAASPLPPAPLKAPSGCRAVPFPPHPPARRRGETDERRRPTPPPRARTPAPGCGHSARGTAARDQGDQNQDPDQSRDTARAPQRDTAVQTGMGTRTGNHQGTVTLRKHQRHT
jgi:hypothetical protein